VAKRGKDEGGNIMPLQNVCVVSTIPFANTNFETQFKQGLGSAGTYKTPKDNQGYVLETLKAAVQDAGSDNNTLVVTVGGLIAGIAAYQLGTVPFISLTGGTAGFANAPTGNFLGGVCLDAYKHDTDRINHLTAKLPITDADQICLLYNGKNAGLAGIEPNIFTYAQSADIDPTNVSSAVQIYTAAFTAIGKIRDANGNPPGIQAVIVSADPFFTQTKDQLKGTASTFPYYVTYPLKDYKTGTAPKQNHSTIHGPKDSLSTVYNKMGKKAKAVFAGHNVGWDHEDLDDPEDQ
jgi:hypothetical protein